MHLFVPFCVLKIFDDPSRCVLGNYFWSFVPTWTTVYFLGQRMLEAFVRMQHHDHLKQPTPFV
eukprot:scaffold438885_cov55-Attheya_sp.AAC.2